MRGFKQKPLSRLSVSNTPAHNSSTECSGCSGGAVRTAGQEDSSTDASASILAANSSTSKHIADANTSTIANANSTGMDGGVDSGQSTKDAGKFITKETYVTKSPVGFMITEALNRKLSHENSVDSMIGHANVAVEELAGSSHQLVNSIYANGMVDDPSTNSTSVVRFSRAVGVLPMPGVKPTALNTIIDAMGKVNIIDFVMVNQQAIDPNDDKPTQDHSLVVLGKEIETEGDTVGSVVTPGEVEDKNFVESVAAIESIEVIIKYRPVDKK